MFFILYVFARDSLLEGKNTPWVLIEDNHAWIFSGAALDPGSPSSRPKMVGTWVDSPPWT